MDTDGFVYEIEAEDFYKDIAKDVEKRSDTNGYSKDDNRALPIGINKKVKGLMKDELGGKIMTEIVIIVIIIIITLFIVDGFQMYKLKCENYNNL